MAIDRHSGHYLNQEFDHNIVLVATGGDYDCDKDWLDDQVKNVNTGSLSVKSGDWHSISASLATIQGHIDRAHRYCEEANWGGDSGAAAKNHLTQMSLSVNNTAEASSKLGTGIGQVGQAFSNAQSATAGGDGFWGNVGQDITGNHNSGTGAYKQLLDDINTGLASMPANLETNVPSDGQTGQGNIDPRNKPIGDPNGVPSSGPGGTGTGGGVPGGHIPAPTPPKIPKPKQIKKDPPKKKPPTTEWPPPTDPPIDPTPPIYTDPPGTGGSGGGGGNYGGGGITAPPSTHIPDPDFGANLAGGGIGDPSSGAGAGFGGGAGGGAVGGAGAGIGGGAGGGIGGGIGGGVGGGAAGGVGGGEAGAAGSGGRFGGGSGGGGVGGASGKSGGATGTGRGMMSPGGHGGGDEQDRERSTWLTEDDDVWGADQSSVPGVTG